jgi:hypothetical protein
MVAAANEVQRLRVLAASGRGSTLRRPLHTLAPIKVRPHAGCTPVSVLLRFPALFEQGRHVENPRPGIRASCVTSSAVGNNAVRGRRFLFGSGGLAIVRVVV